MNILTMDCRGLEFVDFKADVSPLSDTFSNHRSWRTNAILSKGRIQSQGP
jgi:hypothetical protein